ncbi:MAG: trypsin-like peptidase domain-containing protein [Deltaproteobacteria bacterium]|nr:trypsin-like peptidase domain-containing protein [Deltaproteobacteria bacterium]
MTPSAPPRRARASRATLALAALTALAAGPAAAQQPTDGHDFDACQAPTLSLPGQTEDAKKTVVTVITPNGNGTAVVTSSEGIAVTAAHVLGLYDTVMVRMSHGMELEAKVVARDEAKDLALIDIAGGGHPCARVAKTPATLGADVYAIGAPLGTELAFSISKGIISGYPALERGSFLQTDAALNPGNSGGPLFGADGQVQGIVSWKVAGKAAEGIAFAVPAEVVRRTFGPGSGTIGVGSARATIPTARLRITANVEGAKIGIPHVEQFTVSSGGQSGVVSRVEMEAVCEAPCDLTSRPGKYTMVASYKGRYPKHQEIILKEGDDLAYDVKLRRPLGIYVGSSMLVLAGGAIAGGAPIMVDPFSKKSARVGKQLTYAGAAAAVVSIPLMFTSRSVWKKVPTPPPAPATPAPATPAPATPAPTP